MPRLRLPRCAAVAGMRFPVTHAGSRLPAPCAGSRLPAPAAGMKFPASGHRQPGGSRVPTPSR